jgi:hypothetical protein
LLKNIECDIRKLERVWEEKLCQSACCPPFPPKHPKRCNTKRVKGIASNATYFTRSIPCHGCWVSTSRNPHR